MGLGNGATGCGCLSGTYGNSASVNDLCPRNSFVQLLPKTHRRRPAVSRTSEKRFIVDCRGLGARLSGRAFFRTSHVASRKSHVARRTSHLAPGSPSASRARLCHRSLHLGVSRGDLGAHPRGSDTSSAFEKERPLRGPCSYWPTAAPLVRNSPRGWTPRSLTTIRSAGRRAVGWGWPPKPAVTAAVLVRTFRVGEALPRRCAASRGRSRPAPRD